MPTQRSVFDDVPPDPEYRGRHYTGVSYGRTRFHPVTHTGNGGNGGPGEEDQLLDEDELADQGRRRRGWKQRLILSGLSMVVVVCMLGIAAAAYAIYTWGKFERFSDLDLDQVAAGEPVNYLIIGSDERSSQNEGVSGQRADSIVLFRVDPQEETVAVVSIPRDLRVPLADNNEFDPNADSQKINGAYNDGRDNLITTIRENFGIPIHHYIEINFEGFINLIDSVGGVEVFIDQPLHDPRSGLLIEDLGCVTLQGERALQFVRSRHLQTIGDSGTWEDLDQTGDLGRNTRQQDFIRQAVGKALDEAPTDPRQLLSSINALADTVGFDDSISISHMQDLAERFRGLDPNDPEALQTLTLPIVEEEGPADDPFQLYLDELSAEQVFNVFRGRDYYEVNPALINLTVYNGTGGEMEATNVAGAFQQLGFGIAEPADTEDRLAHTTVYFAPGERHVGLQVARHIEGGAVLEPSDALSSGEVELVTGPGLDTIYEQPVPIEEYTPPNENAGGGQDAGGEGQGEGQSEGSSGGGEDAGGEGEGAGSGESGQGEGEGGGGGGTEPPVTPTTTPRYGESAGAGDCG